MLSLATDNTMNPLETIFVNTWNRFVSRSKDTLTGGLPLGYIVLDEQTSKALYYIPASMLVQHISILGKTGQGKSYLIRHMAQHQIDAGRGFALFDLHGDLIPHLLRYIAAKRPTDAHRVVVIDPTSKDWAVGLNPLEVPSEMARFREIAELTNALAARWDFNGARTLELTRAALFVLSCNNLTILEMPYLLSDDSFRARLLKAVTNQETKEYFELRFDPLSDAMKATMREPVLNKLSEFTADPHFRFILGQRQSTISFDSILHDGMILLININKGSLGPQALTLGSLLMAKLKSAIFRKRSRDLFTVFADEMQNLVAADADFETLFSEARKFAVSIVTANQYQNQLTPSLRSAIQAIGTRICFQLSPEDAAQVASEVEGGKSMVERLRRLPPRHVIVRSGQYRPQELVTPDIVPAKLPAEAFLLESNRIYARLRAEIDADIRSRRPSKQATEEALHEWE